MHLKHNSWLTPHPSIVCVELLGRADLQHTLATQSLRDRFSENSIQLCNTLSLITLSKFYFQKPAIVEILAINIKGSFHGTGVKVTTRDSNFALHVDMSLDLPNKK